MNLLTYFNVSKWRLGEIIKTATVQQAGITFTGTLINGVLGALFYFLVARALGPANFGLLVVAITTLTLVTDIANLGTDTGIVRFVSNNLTSNREKAYRFLKLGLLVKLAVWIVVLLIGSIVAPLVANTIFQKEALTFPLRLAFIGVGGALLFSFITSSLQAFQRFWLWSWVQIGTNAARLLIVGLLFFYGVLGLGNALSIYIIIPFIGFFAGLFFLPQQFLKVSKPMDVAPEFFHYNKWVATFTILAAIGARLDTYIVARLLPAAQIGFYGAATQLVSIIPQLVGALGTVVAPKFASFDTKQKAVEYLKKTQLFVLGLAGLGLLAIPFSFIFIPLFYGEDFSPSIPLFIVLLVSMLVFLISVPIHNSIFYYWARPQVFVWLSAGHLAIIGIVGWNLVLRFGAMGAAVTVLVGAVFNFVVPAIWVLYKLKASTNH